MEEQFLKELLTEFGTYFARNYTSTKSTTEIVNEYIDYKRKYDKYWEREKQCSDENKALNLLAVSNSLPHPVHFGRWLLKHAETKFDKDGFLTWQYGKEEKDTKELYDEFLKDESGNDC